MENSFTMQATNLLPMPEFEFGDQRAFKQRSQNDSYRPRRRPPKLYQKHHEISYNRSLNHSIPHAISFRQCNSGNSNSLSSDSSLLNSVYRSEARESFFDQCFDVLDRIGEGSFGVVFKVRSKEDGQLYAVKKSLQLYRGETYRQERIEEVRRYEQFSGHDNCVTLHKAWEQNDLLYMQLELCECSLETYIFANGKLLSEKKIWDIFVDLLLALKALHDENLIHMDIKSENILIGTDGVCKLADFGLVADSRQAIANPSNFSEGDCRYIAPETLESNFTKAADIFSLGITILEVASKVELPRNGFIWQQLRNGVLPEHYLPHVSIELRKIIKWMMSPNPRDRPTVQTLLSIPKIKKILARRKLLAPLNRLKKYVRILMNKWLLLRLFFFGLFTSFLSIFALKSGKRQHIENNNAITSTPTMPTTMISSPMLDISLSRLNDSEICPEDSPSNKSNKSFLRPDDNIIANSTPLNHHNSHGHSRRSRLEVSRISLHFDENESFSGSSINNGISPLKRKKLFDGSDESD